jgi:hypothetical protein
MLHCLIMLLGYGILPSCTHLLLCLKFAATVCVITRGKLPHFAAYEEQLPAAADDVTSAATAGSEQQQQQGGQAQLPEQQCQHQQAMATSTSTCDPTAQGEQQQQQEPQVLQQQQQQQQQHAGNGLPVLIGITNLYFIKMLPQWPNVVSVSKKEAVSRWAAALLNMHACWLPFHVVMITTAY